MGIAACGLNLLLELTRDTLLNGNCLQIGRQTVHLDREQLLALCRPWGLEAKADCLLGAKEVIDDQIVFETLGFGSVESLDYSNYEKPSHLADLNEPVDQSLHNMYDFIYDGGSSEHIFDFPQVLSNYHSMLKVGGILAHAIPSTNHLDHGFYMFSPTLLWDYYLTNKYKFLRAYLVEYNINSALRGASSRVWLYEPINIKDPFSGWSGNSILNWFVVRKLSDSTSGVIPQQGYYRQVWGKEVEYLQRQDIADLLPSLPPHLFGACGSSHSMQLVGYF
jgi:hypothetical protein